jgi:hypothetical protein
MAPTHSTLISSWSKKKEPRYVCLSEAKASHSHKMWTEVSSSVPHFLQMGLSLSPIICRCLLKVLCPVSRPVTTLDCVLSKDNNLDPVARLGPEINSQACLCVLQGPPHNARCCFSIQHFIFLLIVCLEAPQEGLQSNKPLNITTPCELIGDFISSHSGMTRDPIRSHSMLRGDILQSLLALSYQRRRYFSSLKRVQSRLAIRANTNVFLWPILSFNFMNTG